MKSLKKYNVSLLFVLLSLNLLAQYDFTADVTDGCDSLDATFSFISTAIVDTVDTIFWDFGNGYIDTTYDESDVIMSQYTSPSAYTVTVYINDYLTGTSIVRNNYINVHPTVTADFSFRDSIEITTMSVVFEHMDQPFDASATYTFDWDFDDGNTASNIRDVMHTFIVPATYNVSLTVTDNYGCTDTLSQPVTLVGPPDILASAWVGCDSLKVKYTIVGLDPDTITTILWTFGNDSASTLVDPDTVLYTDRQQFHASYTVSAIVNGDTDNEIIRTNLITVHRVVRADFECADTLTSQTELNMVCYNLDPYFDPTATYMFNWQFEGLGAQTGRRPLITYPSVEDTVSVDLTITDQTYGCSDSHSIQIVLSPTLLVQNVFTPNDDQVNDYFMIVTNGNMPLQIKIYSRTGILVYQSKGTEIIWDGKTASGVELNTGIYYYVLQSLDGDPGKRYNKAGFIYLYR